MSGEGERGLIVFNINKWGQLFPHQLLGPERGGRSGVVVPVVNSCSDLADKTWYLEIKIFPNSL